MHNYEDNIIAPVDRILLKEELNQDRFIRKTNKGDNEIYIVNIHNSPNVLKEIGRLREITFRNAGGGTGKPYDLDTYDEIETCYEQLIVYDPEDDEIVGGYRFIDCGIAIEASKDKPLLSTANYFDFTDRFIDDYLRYTIELGRSWVQPQYQPTNNPRKGLFALANIWDGLGALVVDYPHIKYFFGKVTMYPDYNWEARNMLQHFLHHFFPDKENLLAPFNPLVIESDNTEFLKEFGSLDYTDGFRLLQKSIREKGEAIPPLLSIYMNLSATMKTFGTAVNPDFGNVEEIGILVTIDDIYEEKKQRHITNYEGKAK